MTCLLSHNWGFPQAQGVRDRSQRFIRTGPDIQVCLECGSKKVSLLFYEGREPNAFGLARTDEPAVSVGGCGE